MDSKRLAHTLVEEAFDAAPDAQLLLDARGDIFRANASASQLFGYEREALCRMNLAELAPERSRGNVAMVRAPMEAVAAESGAGRSPQLLHALLRDGSELAIVLTLTPLAAGNAGAVLATARRAAVGALDASVLGRDDLRLMRTERAAQVGSWDWDLRTNAIMRSAHLYELYGLPVSQASERPLAYADGVPVEERAALVDRLAAAVRAGKPFSIEHSYLRPDGEMRVFLHQGDPIVEHGEVVRCVGTTHDVTALRKLEREREAALAELLAVLEQCPVGITILRGLRGERLEGNQAAREIRAELGAPSDGMVSYAGQILTEGGDPIPFEELPAVRALRGESCKAQEIRFRRSDGSEVPILVSAAPVRSEHGDITAAVVVTQDIRDAKELDRLRLEWNSVVAHDLRQPLNNIQLYARILAHPSTGLSPEHRAHVHAIQGLVARLTRMTNDLLDLSRIEARRLSLAVRPVELAPLVQSCVDTMARLAIDHRFELHVVGEALPIAADPDRISQVMENLLTNAVKYSTQGSAIRVEVVQSKAEACVSVTNRGHGIAQADLERLFQRFERVGKAARQGVPGIGLGLHTSQALVEAHGGRMSVESKVDDLTTFRFTLPVRPAAGAP
jgi:PAS domain S-box-containing protein